MEKSNFDYIIGLDQVVTGNTGLVVLDCGGLWVHDALLEGTDGDYKAQAEQLVGAIKTWITTRDHLSRIGIQAEEVFFRRGVHTFRLLVSLLVRLEADLEYFAGQWEHSIEWLAPITAPAIDKEFGIIKYRKLKGTKVRRDARKKEIQTKVEAIWGVDYEDDRADAALLALYALRRVTKVALVE